MPPTLGDRLSHILTAIDAIESMLATKTIENYAADFPLRLAVERALEIICEASLRIPADVKARQSTIDWRKRTDFGNLLRHAYHRVDAQTVFEITKHELPPLRAFAEHVLREDNGT